MKKLIFITLLMTIICSLSILAVNVTISDSFDTGTNVNWTTFTATWNTSIFYGGTRSARIFYNAQKIDNTSMRGTGPFNLQFAYYSPPDHTYISNPGIRLKNGGDRVLAIAGGNNGFGLLDVFDGTATFNLMSPLNITNEWVFFDIMYYSGNESCHIQSHYKDNSTINITVINDCTQNDHDDITAMEFIEQSPSDGDVYFIDNVKVCSGGVCPSAPIVPNATTILYPSGTPQLYQNLYVNATTNYNTTCTINDTQFSIDYTNGSIHNFKNNTGIPEGGYSINVSCTQTSATASFTVDYTRPINFTARNNLTNASITNFNVTYLGIVYHSSGGYVAFNTSYFITEYNATVTATNYDSKTEINLDATNDNVTTYLYPHYYSGGFQFYNIIEYNGSNYTRNINYSIDVVCPLGSSTYAVLYINNTPSYNGSASCTGTNVTRFFNFTYSVEGYHDLAIFFNTTDSSFHTFGANRSALIDLFAPRITQLNYTTNYNPGFYTALTNLTINCSDNVTTRLWYNMSFNEVQFYNNHLQRDSLIKNETAQTTGVNILRGVCGDLFSNTSGSFSDTIYFAEIHLIDEKENIPFNLSNINSSRVYWDDNSSYYDFKTNYNHSVNFTAYTSSQLRFEFIYDSGTVVTRYVDLAITPNPLRICINPEGTTHYEQIIQSSTQRPVIMKNVFSNCIIGADYTRFTYQDSLSLKVFTVESLYYLYTFENDTDQLFLSSIDGSTATYINLDNLIFNLEGYDIDIIKEQLATEVTDYGEVTIYYNNYAEDNLGLTATIINQDTGTTVFTTSDFSDYNNFQLLFDYSTLTNITNNTIFKLNLARTTSSGTSTLTRYFGIDGDIAIYTSGFALILSIFLVVGGLTWTISRLTLSWFGILVILAGIVILRLGVSTWYTTFLGIIYVIMLIYSVIIMTNQNYPSIGS